MHSLVIVWLDKKGNAQKSLLPTSELYRYKNNEKYSHIGHYEKVMSESFFGGNRTYTIKNSYGLKVE